MKTTLDNADYKTILQFYKKQNTEKKLTNKQIKSQAENILASKLCKCIKKVTKKNRVKPPGAIGICTKSIFHRKKLKYNRFTCKNKPKLIPNKKTHRSLTKIKTF